MTRVGGAAAVAVKRKDARVRQELLKIQMVTDSLRQCQLLSDKMISILQSFEDKLDRLGETMHPIHRSTHSLTTKQKNLRDTIRVVDDIIANHNLALRAKSLVSSANLSLYRDFLGRLARIREGIQFFNEHKTFKNTDRCQRELRDALRLGVEKCEAHFVKLLMDSLPYNPKSLLFVDVFERQSELKLSVVGAAAAHSGGHMGGDADALEDARGVARAALLDSALVERLGSMAGCLRENGRQGFIDTLVGDRSKRLASFMEEVIEKQAYLGPADAESRQGSAGAAAHGGSSRSLPPRRATGASAGHSRQASDINAGSSAPEAGKHGRRPQYERGSHRSLFYLRVLLHALLVEHVLFKDMLIKHAGVPPLKSHIAYCSAVEIALDYTLKRVLRIIKEQEDYGLLVALDVMRFVLEYFDDFRAVLAPAAGVSREVAGPKPGARVRKPERTPWGVQLRRLRDFEDKLGALCGQALDELKSHILKSHKTVKRGTRKKRIMDGTVHVVTVQTLNYLINDLHPYGETLERLARSQLKEVVDIRARYSAKEATTTVGAILLWFLDVLQQALRDIASREIPNACLGWVFLLNNLQLIHKRVAESKAVAGDIKRREFNEKYYALINEARQRYLDMSWSRCLEAISLSDRDAVFARCQRRIVPDGAALFTPDKVAKKAIKAKFAEFNHCFGKQYSRQKAWAVPDAALRSQLRNANTELLLPRYEEFYALYKTVGFSRNVGKYMRFRPSVLAEMLSELFELGS